MPELEFKFSGTEELSQNLRELADKVSSEDAARALREEAEEIMTRSKREFVPVDLGTLRSSGQVQPVERSFSSLSVTLSFGGAAAPYALIQHEADFQHKVGTRKYLERPLREAMQGMLGRIAQRIQL